MATERKLEPSQNFKKHLEGLPNSLGAVYQDLVRDFTAEVCTSACTIHYPDRRSPDLNVFRKAGVGSELLSVIRTDIRTEGRNFAAIDPFTRFCAIRVEIHSSFDDLEGVPDLETLLIIERPHSQEKRKKEGPPVQHILVTKREEVHTVVKCAIRAREKWGKGER